MLNLSRAALTRRVRRHLAEESTAQFSDLDIREELSRAERGLALSLGLFRRVWRPSTALGVWQLTPPTEWAGHGYGSALRDREPLTRISLERARLALEPAAFSAGAGVGLPSHWAWDEEGQAGVVGAVLLWPIPGGVYPLTFSYLAAPAPMAQDGDVPWFGLFGEFHDVLALEAAHLLLAQQGVGAGNVGIFGQRRDERLRAFQNALSKNRNTERLSVRSTLSRPPVWRRP